MRFLNVDSKREKSTHYLLFKRGSKIQCTPKEQKSPLNIAIIKRFSAVYHKKVRTEHTNSSSCMKMHNIANSFHVFCNIKVRNIVKFFCNQNNCSLTLLSKVSPFSHFSFKSSRLGWLCLLVPLVQTMGSKQGTCFWLASLLHPWPVVFVLSFTGPLQVYCQHLLINSKWKWLWNNRLIINYVYISTYLLVSSVSKYESGSCEFAFFDKVTWYVLGVQSFLEQKSAKQNWITKTEQ